MKYFHLLLFSIIVFFIAPGCSLEKRHYRSGYHITRISKKPDSKENSTVRNRESHSIQYRAPEEAETVIVSPTEESFASASTKEVTFPRMVRRVLLSLLPPDSCDLIILKNGEEVKGNVLEISSDVIKYRKCDNPDGPVYSTRKSEVFMVKYKNGQKEVFESTPAPSSQQQSKNETPAQPKKLLPMSLISFIASLVAFIVAGIILGAAAVIFGIASAVKIAQHPDKYKGMGFAVAGIVLGLVAFILTAAYISSM